MSPRPRGRAARSRSADGVLEPGDASLLDLIDNLLNKGVVLTGDVVLGVASVDLVYLRLSAVLCAADRLLPSPPPSRRRKRPLGARRGEPRTRSS